ncbi:MAG: cob(I)yrinic acid a,c-diamide adenosyltransferase [Chloroflexi bacterium]|nr:MAG: cob(I)yrinic acid a,c-diamide adenosyltransferase [Chloroflexota bacterium]TMF53485.1 MAG: cob(I)yrinic acid a,c-diamide adenosyltransferase [Chloroflexota bacterium]
MLELSGTGDDGTTGLLGGGRSPKDDPRIEAFGTVDEASSALGLARALTSHARVTSICEELQRGLYAVGAELGTNPEADKTFVVTGPPQIQRLEQLISELESEAVMPQGFILPGATPASGALDLARAITRRAERRCVTLERAGGLPNPDVRRWLNRLSLVLFVLGRYEESQAGRRAQPAKGSEPERSS